MYHIFCQCRIAQLKNGEAQHFISHLRNFFSACLLRLFVFLRLVFCTIPHRADLVIKLLGLR